MAGLFRILSSSLFLLILEMVPDCRCKKADYLKSSIVKKQRRQINVPQINIHVTAPLFTARLYDFGQLEGDQMASTSIDSGVRFELKHPITFYGQRYKEIYILSNGGIGFDQESRHYKQNILRDSATPVLATLWNRNDLRKGGQIFFREITNGRSLERGQSEVRYQYNLEVKPISMVIVSWIRMQPFGDQQLDPEATNQVQLALINTENETYANIIYKNIGWSLNAEAGFTSGSGGGGQNFLALPWSATNNIISLKENGNTGIPGEWIFKIDGQRIISCPVGKKGDTCDEECTQNEWGFDCAHCCHCQTGRCDAFTGACGNNQCKSCWVNAPVCNKRDPSCNTGVKECGPNAVAFTNRDHCGETTLRCQCLTGFTGDGYNCTDIDECASRRNPCGENSQCLNTQGGYLCHCSQGFVNLPNNRTMCIPDLSGSASSNRSSNRINNANVNKANNNSSGSNENWGALDKSFSTTVIIPWKTSTTAAGTSPSDFNRENSSTTTILPLDFGDRDVVVLDFTSESAEPVFTENVPKATVDINDQLESQDAKITAKPVVLPRFLPKETNSHLIYNLSYPIKIFGQIRDTLTVWSTGVVALGRTEPVNFDKDLLKSGVHGFVPFFDKIDLGRDEGNVIIGETSDAEILSDATAMVRQHFQSYGFLATSVLTVTFENVTSPNGRVTNTFEVVLISGYNALRENVTYVEFVYNKINWYYNAKAMILPEDSSYAYEFPGSGTDNVKQLEKFSNIQLPGEWMYRVDGPQRVQLCPVASRIPPFCELEKEATSGQSRDILPATATNGTSDVIPTATSLYYANTTISNDAVTNFTQTTRFKHSHPLIDFEGNGETITFPSFITLVPQLVTLSGQQRPPQVQVHAPAPVPTIRLPQVLTNVVLATQPIIRPITTTKAQANSPTTMAKSYYSSTTAPTNGFSTLPVINDKSVNFSTFPIPLNFTLGAEPGPSSTNAQPQLVTTVAPPAAVVTQIFRPGPNISGNFTHLLTSGQDVTFSSGEKSTLNLPPLQIFTLATTRRSTRPPVPIKVPTTKSIGQQPKGKDRVDNDGSVVGDQSKKFGGRTSDDDDSLNSAGKLAIIIPTAIVGVWLLLLVLIGAVVCCRRRGSKRRYRTKYDPSAAYFRSIVDVAPSGGGNGHSNGNGNSGHPAATMLQHTNGGGGGGGGGNGNGNGVKERTSASNGNGYYHQRYHHHDSLDNGHVTDKTEMCHHGQCQGSRPSGYNNSYWDGPNSSRQQNQQSYGYYNQGYYDSCPDNRHTFSARY